MRIDFQTSPEKYRHWRLSFDGPVATLTMDVDEKGGLRPDYDLKLNSYDLGVDIELNDAVQRLRFEHPEVKVVILRSGKERVFCAGANIRMLSSSTHAHKVNFCKFTNETRNAMEAASADSGQFYICAVNGTAAGGGYELALATDYIVMVDDNSAAVSLPEVPLLAVLPGTGGLTRVTDKRKVRRDRADIFCTLEEGIKGKRAVDWRLIDEAVKVTALDERLGDLAKEFAQKSDRPDDEKGVSLTPLSREFGDDFVRYPHVAVDIDRALGVATFTLKAPEADAPKGVKEIAAEGDKFWPLALTRELDDAILHMRLNELPIGVWIIKSEGSPQRVVSYDEAMRANKDHWLVREILGYWKRTMKRLDVTSRTLITLAEPGSCFAGFLAEPTFASDRSFMFIGSAEGDNRPEARLILTESNFGPFPMGNGLSRLETRFLGEPQSIQAAHKHVGEEIDGKAADEMGLVTESYDDIDWDDEVRIMIEERASFSPDGLTGLEANLRFPGPETMETKIFGRLTAWQNWIFQRPNAAGPEGALKKYGTGVRPDYDKERV
ncbi:MAG: 2,3-epoxybenzoyl-CoA dihydrolase [Hyphomicrobiales bacterium]|nr:2,3-epoxybenzoyl-CoA dihydrolase [Hyphomicrobiales bacterium]